MQRFKNQVKKVEKTGNIKNFIFAIFNDYNEYNKDIKDGFIAASFRIYKEDGGEIYGN